MSCEWLHTWNETSYKGHIAQSWALRKPSIMVCDVRVTVISLLLLLLIIIIINVLECLWDSLHGHTFCYCGLDFYGRQNHCGWKDKFWKGFFGDFHHKQDHKLHIAPTWSLHTFSPIWLPQVLYFTWWWENSASVSLSSIFVSLSTYLAILLYVSLFRTNGWKYDASPLPVA